MNKKLVTIPIITVAIIFLVISLNEKQEENPPVFHVRLADPELYIDGLYTQSFVINEGLYSFKFVPNGDSPKNLEIHIQGKDFEFFEKFTLNGTLHQTGISEYFTWDYDGEKSINVENMQEVKITINPNGNLMGPVSISLIEN